MMDYAVRLEEAVPRPLAAARGGAPRHAELGATILKLLDGVWPVVTTAHWGEYSEMAGAYAALESWCRDNGRRLAGMDWEVYGDWADDPQQRRTDIYRLLQPLT